MKDFLRTNHANICYEYIRSEKENAETILLLHGLGLNMTIWDETIEYFTIDYHVLRYDLPGHSRSELFQLDILRWDLLIDDLECLLDHLNIKELHFFGHSGAGNFGIELALRKKPYIKSLTLISTPLFSPREVTEKEMNKRNNWTNREMFNQKMLHLAKNICYPEEQDKIARIIEMYNQVSIDVYLAYFNLYSHTIYHYKIEQLAKIELPIQLIVGEFDSLYPPQMIMVNLSYLANASFLIIPEASNAVMIDRPQRFTEDIKTLLSRLTNKKSVTTYDYTNTMINKINSIVYNGVKHKDARIELHILEKFELILDGTIIEGKWTQRKAMQIITYIICNRSVTRERLYELFWPEYELNKASSHQSVSLNHIKSLIEASTLKNIDDYFDITRDIISLKHKAYVDIKELENSLQLLTNETDEIEKIKNSLELLQSLPENLFSGFYEDWFVSLKTNIETQILYLCEQLLECNLSEQEKVTVLKIMITNNPLEETYYERLIDQLQDLDRPETTYYKEKLAKLSGVKE